MSTDAPRFDDIVGVKNAPAEWREYTLAVGGILRTINSSVTADHDIWRACSTELQTMVANVLMGAESTLAFGERSAQHTRDGSRHTPRHGLTPC